MSEILSFLTCLSINEAEFSSDPVGVFCDLTRDVETFETYFEVRNALKPFSLQVLLVGPDGELADRSGEYLILPTAYLQGYIGIATPRGSSGPHDVELWRNERRIFARRIQLGAKS